MLQLSEDLSGKKVGLVTEGFDLSDDDVSDVVRASAMKLKEKGATVEEVSIPIHIDGTIYKKHKILITPLFNNDDEDNDINNKSIREEA